MTNISHIDTAVLILKTPKCISTSQSTEPTEATAIKLHMLLGTYYLHFGGLP